MITIWQKQLPWVTCSVLFKITQITLFLHWMIANLFLCGHVNLNMKWWNYAAQCLIRLRTFLCRKSLIYYLLTEFANARCWFRFSLYRDSHKLQNTGAETEVQLGVALMSFCVGSPLSTAKSDKTTTDCHKISPCNLVQVCYSQLKFDA